MLKMFPELFSRIRVRTISSYPKDLRNSLAASAPIACSGRPVIAVLTPGIHNSAYFEHAFLADEMGAELVEGHDLRVVDGRVAARTTKGHVPIDVLYRRVDDDFLDPLNFRPDSVIGVPGMLDVYRAGGITLANAPGTGIADDKAIYSYMPEIVEFYTGEKALLKNVPTWRCSEPEALAYVDDHLAELVVKEVHGSGGYGMLVGPAASKRELARFRAKLKAHPENYIAQPHPLAVDGADFGQGGPGTPSRGSPTVRAGVAQSGRDHAGRAHARRSQKRIAGRQFEPGRRHQGHMGSR